MRASSWFVTGYTPTPRIPRRDIIAILIESRFVLQQKPSEQYSGVGVNLRHILTISPELDHEDGYEHHDERGELPRMEPLAEEEHCAEVD